MAFDDQAVKAMTDAYESILVELRLTDRQDSLTETIASKVIEYCQTGECDPKRLVRLTLNDIRGSVG
jgi:hypothetical protein